MSVQDVIDGTKRWHVHTGDTLEWLRTLPDESVNCCVTSPPYWGLRDYGVDGQIGLEATINDYIDRIVAVFAEVRRAMRKDGTLWMNVGDAFSASGSTGGKNGKQGTHPGSFSRPDRRNGRGTGLKPKDLIGIPWMLAFALRADGFYLRQDIIWAKPNPMPESVTDRCTKAHEYLFLLSKSKSYYYNAAAIRTPSKETNADRPRMGQGPNTQYAQKRKSMKMPDGWDSSKGGGGHGSFHKNGREAGKTVDLKEDRQRRGYDAKAASQADDATANARSVWTIPTYGYPGAHFATFPPKLVEPCILAGCPEDGIVLEPFVGSGTTIAVAVDLGRRAIGAELNPDYVKMAEKRIRAVTPPMF